MKSEPLLEFSDSPIPNKITYGAKVILDLTTNAADFPNLPYSVLTLTNTNKALSDKALLAAGGDHTAEKDLLAEEIIWKTQFVADAKYVGIVANGDEVLILKGGQTPSSGTRVPKQKEGELLAFTAESTKAAGGLEAETATKKDNVEAFTFVFAPPAVEVTQIDNLIEINVGGVSVFVLTSTHGHVTVSGLPSGAKFDVFGAATNSAGTGPITSTGNTVTTQ